MVRLRSRDGADSRLSELSWGKVGERVNFWEFVSETSGRESCESCIEGEEAVAKWSIGDELVEAAADLLVLLCSERE